MLELFDKRSSVTGDRGRLSIEHKELDESGEPKLPRLQDHVEMVHLIEQGLLRPVQSELGSFALLAGDPIEIVQAPAPVTERPIERSDGIRALPSMAFNHSAID